MLMHRRRTAQGFNLIEMLIGLAVLGVLFLVGVPGMSTWMQSTQVRNSAEAITAGLTLARTEALRRNRTVLFTLTSSLDSGCAASLTGTSWVVSLADPSGACDAAPSENAAPQILQKRSGSEGTPNATVNATGASAVQFNGLGRIAAFPVGGISIDVRNATGACQDASGSIRCLRVVVTASGGVRMCDPAVPVASPPTDPRQC